MTDYGLLTVERDAAIATITLNRPEKRNALSDALRRQVAAAVEDVGADDSVSVAILTGAGTAFCAGFDKSEFGDATGADVPGAGGEFGSAESGLIMHERLQNFPKPLIGAINGPAMGGGFDIAVQCDVRIASEDAVFGHPEIKFGAPTMFTILSYIIGGAAARDLCLSGRGVDAEEALRLGLASKVVPRDRLLGEAMAYARIVADAPPDALRIVKKAVIESAPLRFP